MHIWLLAVFALLVVAHGLRNHITLDSDLDISSLLEDAAHMIATVPCGELQKMYQLEERKVGDYTFEKCLGGGANGEAWLAKKDTVESNAVGLVVKMLKHSGPVTALEHECTFAHEAKKRDASHFVECMGTGGLQVTTEVMLPFIAFELAEGKELERVLHSLKSRTDAVTGLALADVVSKTLELYGVMEELSQPNNDGTVLYATDLSPSNLMLSEQGRLTIVDYGDTYICSTETGVGSFSPCTEQIHSHGKAMNTQYLVMDFLSMLVQRDEGISIESFNREVLRGLLMKAMEDVEKATTEVETKLRFASEAPTGLLSTAIREGLVRMVALLGGDSAWPPAAFVDALKAAHQSLV